MMNSAELKAKEMVQKHGADAVVQTTQCLYLCNIDKKDFWTEVLSFVNKQSSKKILLKWE